MFSASVAFNAIPEEPLFLEIIASCDSAPVFVQVPAKGELVSGVTTPELATDASLEAARPTRREGPPEVRASQPHHISRDIGRSLDFRS